MQNSLSKIGLGLRHPHLAYFAKKNIPLPLLEIHAENFFHPETREYLLLKEINKNYRLSVHAVGLSLGSYTRPSKDHMHKLRKIEQDLKPELFSEHLSWSQHDGQYFNDLIALPYTQESLDIVSRNITIFQDFLGRQILIENPSSYISYKESTIEEAEFLNLICEKTGCALLLDVNNIFVSAHNLNFSSANYLQKLELNNIAEIHIAGPEEIKLPNQENILIDSHSSYPQEEALNLLQQVAKHNKSPIILEWDQNIPSATQLISYAKKIEISLNDA